MLVDVGDHEALKATIHGTMGLLALVVTTYNMAAWQRRRAPHLAVNATLFLALTAVEAWHVAEHLAEGRDG